MQPETLLISLFFFRTKCGSGNIIFFRFILVHKGIFGCTSFTCVLPLQYELLGAETKAQRVRCPVYLWNHFL